jgi:hypothetical protein
LCNCLRSTGILNLIIIILTILSSFALADDNGLGKPEFDKILKIHWDRKEYRFDRAGPEINADFLDLRDFTADPIVPGTAFGAKANCVVSAKIDEIEGYYLTKGNYENFDIPTQALRIISAQTTPTKLEIFADLLIRAPVIKDIPVKDLITFEKFEKFAWMRWFQDDPNSPLLWNRGYLILEPFREEKTLVSVYAIHVLKPNEALPWLMRVGGPSFALSHYSNYLKSLKSAAKNFKK